MERKLRGKKFGYTSWGCPLFWKFRKMLFHSPPEVAKNSNRKFKLNVKCLRFSSKKSNWSLLYYLQKKMSIQITTQIGVSGNCMAKLIYFYKLTNFVRSWTKWSSLKEYVITLLNDKQHCLSLYAYGDHKIF